MPSDLFKWDTGQKVAPAFNEIYLDIANKDNRIYRVGAATLGIDNNLEIGGTLKIASTIYAENGLYVGSIHDTMLARGGTNILQTAQSMRIGTGLVVGNVLTTPADNQILADGLISGLELAGTGQGISYGLTIGTDCQLYRGAANVWDTPDSMRILTGLVVGNNSDTPYADDILVDGGINVGSSATGDPPAGVITANYMRGVLSLRPKGVTYVNAGVLTVEAGYSLYQIDEPGTAAINLDTISGGYNQGDLLLLRGYDSDYTITVRGHASGGNIYLSSTLGNFAMSGGAYHLLLYYTGANWIEICRLVYA